MTAAAPTTTWPALTDLSSDTSQRVFHHVMEAFSRPGTLHDLPASAVPSPVPAAIVPLLALVDLMTPLAAVTSEAATDAGQSSEADPTREADFTREVDLTATDPTQDAVAAVARLTGAAVAQPSQARFALALDGSADFSDLAPGSHWSPEQGAMLVQRVAAIRLGSDADGAEGAEASEAGPAHGAWRLTGPGVAPHTDTIIRVSGLSESWVSTRERLVADYPAGIDCLLVTDEGAFVALPRTTTIEVI